MTDESKSSYSPGLAGVYAGETAICWVDPNAGLTYRGYDIHELATKACFEEIAWLLLHGELPSADELNKFRQLLATERTLPAPVLAMFRLLPENTHPMDALRTGVSMLAPYDPDLNDLSHEANVRKASRLISQMSTLVTDYWRIRNGQELIPSRNDLPHAANFLYQLTGKLPEIWQTEALDIIFALYADHEFNASTFAARVTASTLADIYAAVTTATGTLKGPLHGGANEDAMTMLRDIGSPDHAESWMKGRLERKEKISGFGHRVYKLGDSRVPAMRDLARAIGKRLGQEQWVPLCEKLEQIMEREKHLYANLDLYAAPVFTMMGLPTPINTPIFACARAAGWCAHVVEQHDHNRLIRPRSLYTGPAMRPYATRG
jgi:2-methylcitrate synthase/citrate synthase II